MSTASWKRPPRRTSGLLLGSMLAVLPPASTLVAGQIDITAKAVNPSLLVGEPLVLSVTMRADVPVVFPTDLMSPGLPFRVLIDRGSGLVPYVEYSPPPGPESVGTGPQPDGLTREFILAFDAATRDWTFPSAGTF